MTVRPETDPARPEADRQAWAEALPLHLTPEQIQARREALMALLERGA